MKISEAFAIAVEHHRAGRLELAEEIYRRILAVEPEHADALHLLGVIAHQRGQHSTAVEYIHRAVELSPSFAVYQGNPLGEAYRALHRTVDAIACYQRAIQLNPHYAG